MCIVRMSRVLFYLHATSVMAAAGLAAACWAILPWARAISARPIIVAFAAIGLLSGLALLATLPGISRSAVLVGVSTITACVLLLFSI